MYSLEKRQQRHNEAIVIVKANGNMVLNQTGIVGMQKRHRHTAERESTEIYY